MSNNNPLKANPAGPIDEDAPGRLFLVADSGDIGYGRKLKMIVQLVKKCLGVKAIAAVFVFFSLSFLPLASVLLVDDFLACLTTTQASFVTCSTPGTYP